MDEEHNSGVASNLLSIPVTGALQNNSLKWGCLTGEKDIKNSFFRAYAEIQSWKANAFVLPSGKGGSEFIVVSYSSDKPFHK